MKPARRSQTATELASLLRRAADLASTLQDEVMGELEQFSASSLATSTDQIFYSVPEAARVLAISRSTLYELMDAGDIVSIKMGRRRMIHRDDLEAFAQQKRDDAAREKATCQRKAEQAVKRLRAL